MRQSRRAWLLQQLIEQQRWMDAHGGDKAGYVAHYGSASRTTFDGAGGEAIYEADKAALEHWRRQLARAAGK